MKKKQDPLDAGAGRVESPTERRKLRKTIDDGGVCAAAPTDRLL